MSSAPYDVDEVIVTARPVAGAVHLDGQNIFIHRAATAGGAGP